MDESFLTARQTPLALRKMVLAETNQDVLRCHGCGSCNLHQLSEEVDISLDSLVQMILQNDREVLTTKTVWSDEVLESIQYACQRGLNLRLILLALRKEAYRLGLKEENTI